MKLKKLIVLYALLCACCSYSQYCNEVLKIFYNNNTENAMKDEVEKAGYENIGLGNIVFYFSQRPIVNFVPERGTEKVQNNSSQDWRLFSKDMGNSGQMNKKVFIFPKAVLKSSYCQNKIKKINNSPAKGYALHIEAIKAPIDGVKLSIVYDPEVVDFEYEIFESMSNEMGVIFNFYNKRVINEIKNKEDNVLCIVENNITFLNEIYV